MPSGWIISHGGGIIQRDGIFLLLPAPKTIPASIAAGVPALQQFGLAGQAEAAAAVLHVDGHIGRGQAHQLQIPFIDAANADDVGAVEGLLRAGLDMTSG